MPSLIISVFSELCKCGAFSPQSETKSSNNDVSLGITAQTPVPTTEFGKFYQPPEGFGRDDKQNYNERAFQTVESFELMAAESSYVYHGKSESINVNVEDGLRSRDHYRGNSTERLFMLADTYLPDNNLTLSDRGENVLAQVCCLSTSRQPDLLQDCDKTLAHLFQTSLDESVWPDFSTENKQDVNKPLPDKTLTDLFRTNCHEQSWSDSSIDSKQIVNTPDTGFCDDFDGEIDAQFTHDTGCCDHVRKDIFSKHVNRSRNGIDPSEIEDSWSPDTTNDAILGRHTDVCEHSLDTSRDQMCIDSNSDVSRCNMYGYGSNSLFAVSLIHSSEGCDPGSLVGAPKCYDGSTLVDAPEGSGSGYVFDATNDVNSGLLVCAPEGCDPDSLVDASQDCNFGLLVDAAESYDRSSVVGAPEYSGPGCLFRATENIDPDSLDESPDDYNPGSLADAPQDCDSVSLVEIPETYDPFSLVDAPEDIDPGSLVDAPQDCDSGSLADAPENYDQSSVVGAPKCSGPGSLIDATEDIDPDSLDDAPDDCDPGSLVHASEDSGTGCFVEASGSCDPGSLVNDSELCDYGSLVDSSEGCDPEFLASSVPEGCVPGFLAGAPEGCNPDFLVGATEDCNLDILDEALEGCVSSFLASAPEGYGPEYMADAPVINDSDCLFDAPEGYDGCFLFDAPEECGLDFVSDVPGGSGLGYLFDIPEECDSLSLVHALDACHLDSLVHAPEACHLDSLVHAPEACHPDNLVHAPEACHPDSLVHAPEACHPDSLVHVPEACHLDSLVHAPEACHPDSLVHAPEACHLDSLVHALEACHPDSLVHAPEACHPDSLVHAPEACHPDSLVHAPEACHPDSLVHAPEACHLDSLVHALEACHPDSLVHAPEACHPDSLVLALEACHPNSLVDPLDSCGFDTLLDIPEGWDLKNVKTENMNQATFEESANGFEDFVPMSYDQISVNVSSEDVSQATLELWGFAEGTVDDVSRYHITDRAEPETGIQITLHEKIDASGDFIDESTGCDTMILHSINHVSSERDKALESSVDPLEDNSLENIVHENEKESVFKRYFNFARDLLNASGKQSKKMPAHELQIVNESQTVSGDVQGISRKGESVDPQGKAMVERKRDVSYGFMDVSNDRVTETADPEPEVHITFEGSRDVTNSMDASRDSVTETVDSEIQIRIEGGRNVTDSMDLDRCEHDTHEADYTDCAKQLMDELEVREVNNENERSTVDEVTLKAESFSAVEHFKDTAKDYGSAALSAQVKCEKSNCQIDRHVKDSLTCGTVSVDAENTSGALVHHGEILTDKCSEGEILTDKCSEGKILTDKCSEGEILTDKCSEGEILTDKCSEGEILTDKCSEGEILTDKCSEGEILTDKCSDGSLVDALLVCTSVSADAKRKHDVVHHENNLAKVSQNHSYSSTDSKLTNQCVFIEKSEQCGSVLEDHNFKYGNGAGATEHSLESSDLEPCEIETKIGGESPRHGSEAGYSEHEHILVMGNRRQQDPLIALETYVIGESDGCFHMTPFGGEEFESCRQNKDSTIELQNMHGENGDQYCNVDPCVSWKQEETTSGDAGDAALEDATTNYDNGGKDVHSRFEEMDSQFTDWCLASSVSSNMALLNSQVMNDAHSDSPGNEKTHGGLSGFHQAHRDEHTGQSWQEFALFSHLTGTGLNVVSLGDAAVTEANKTTIFHGGCNDDGDDSDADSGTSV